MWEIDSHTLFNRKRLSCCWRGFDSRNALTIDQECILKVQELFGCVKDGIVDRKALGRIVFHDKNAKKQLEAIIHPYVILKMKEEIEKIKREIVSF